MKQFLLRYPALLTNTSTRPPQQSKPFGQKYPPAGTKTNPPEKPLPIGSGRATAPSKFPAAPNEKNRRKTRDIRPLQTCDHSPANSAGCPGNHCRQLQRQPPSCFITKHHRNTMICSGIINISGKRRTSVNDCPCCAVKRGKIFSPHKLFNLSCSVFSVPTEPEHLPEWRRLFHWSHTVNQLKHFLHDLLLHCAMSYSDECVPYPPSAFLLLN